MFPASDTAAKLMQLSKSETVCVINNHDCRIGNVDPHFNDSGRNEHLYLIGLEPLHNVVFFTRAQLSVHQTRLETGQTIQ